MAATYIIPEHETGTTFEGLLFEVKINDIALDLTGSEVTATFRHSKNWAVIKILSLGHGLTLVTPASGTFKLDRQLINWRAGLWDYEIRFELTDGTVKDYIEGTWNLVN